MENEGKSRFFGVEIVDFVDNVDFWALWTLWTLGRWYRHSACTTFVPFIDEGSRKSEQIVINVLTLEDKGL